MTCVHEAGANIGGRGHDSNDEYGSTDCCKGCYCNGFDALRKYMVAIDSGK